MACFLLPATVTNLSLIIVLGAPREWQKRFPEIASNLVDCEIHGNAGTCILEILQHWSRVPRDPVFLSFYAALWWSGAAYVTLLLMAFRVHLIVLNRKLGVGYWEAGTFYVVYGLVAAETTSLFAAPTAAIVGWFANQ
jgi:hypothetical protein